jgi:hypothetical protein
MQRNQVYARAYGWPSVVEVAVRGRVGKFETAGSSQSPQSIGDEVAGEHDVEASNSRASRGLVLLQPPAEHGATTTREQTMELVELKERETLEEAEQRGIRRSG